MSGTILSSSPACPDAILTLAVRGESVRAVLLDIEGTTTPLDFVSKVLFPYAQSHARQFLAQHLSSSEVRNDILELRKENDSDMRKGLNPPSFRGGTPQEELESVITYLDWLMERDRKAIPLKSLQGKIWEEGYRRGQLRSQVFDDVPRALERWKKQERGICIFSSGSVLAQKLLFSHTTAGDLTPYISHYFDTITGSKIDSDSYEKIARALQRLHSEVVFISDAISELDAGRSAGMQTLLCWRPGNRPQPPSTHARIQTFDEVLP